MRLDRLRTLALALLATLAAAGCSDGPTSPGGDQAALAAALASMEHAGVSAGVLASGAPVLPATGPMVPSACSWQAGSGNFVCPPVTHGGVTVRRSFALLDAAGNPRQQFDAQVVTIRSDFVREGTHATSTVTMAMADTGSLRLTDFRTDRPHIDGVVNAHMRLSGAAMDGASMQLEMESVETIAALVPPQPPGRYPRGGTITREQSIRPDGEGGDVPGYTMRMVLAFDGTSQVTVTLGSGATTQTCVMDLATLASTCDFIPTGITG